jgi:hypothetical protein
MRSVARCPEWSRRVGSGGRLSRSLQNKGFTGKRIKET